MVIFICFYSGINWGEYTWKSKDPISTLYYFLQLHLGSQGNKILHFSVLQLPHLSNEGLTGLRGSL